MRSLGIGYAGLQMFCGIMDLPKCVTKTFYNTIVGYIRRATELVAKESMNRAAMEESLITGAGIDNFNGEIAVSGDGTWQKRGFSSLHGVATLIGMKTGKVIDIIVKSSYCKVCEFLKKNQDENTEDRRKQHEAVCESNHAGSAGKMEIGGIVEMFQRSVQLHQLKYVNYIGDGDCKTYKGIVDSQPYGLDITILKKECIGPIQKRMGNRLRNIKKAKKGFGGRGKLTANLIDKLTTYYGLAIRRNCNSVEDMRNAIWATYQHKCSTDKNPKHNYCPPGSESWCLWQRANAEGNLNTFVHESPLHPDVQAAIKPAYEELATAELLERCLGGFSQNRNESLNSKIWRIAPKTSFCGSEIVNIAAYFAACTFNDGASNILQILKQLNILIGPKTLEWSETSNNIRVTAADRRASLSTKEGRIEIKRKRKATEDLNT